MGNLKLSTARLRQGLRRKKGEVRVRFKTFKTEGRPGLIYKKMTEIDRVQKLKILAITRIKFPRNTSIEKVKSREFQRFKITKVQNG